MTGDEPQGTMGRVQLLPAFLCAHIFTKREGPIRTCVLEKMLKNKNNGDEDGDDDYGGCFLYDKVDEVSKLQCLCANDFLLVHSAQRPKKRTHSISLWISVVFFFDRLYYS